jgi:transposase
LKQVQEIGGVAVGEVVWGWGYRGGREAQNEGVGPEVWTQKQERRVGKAVSEGQFRTIGEAVAWCGKELAVEVSYKKLYDWFRRWGYRKKVPQPMAEKTNAQAQKAWKKGYGQPCRRRG